MSRKEQESTQTGFCQGNLKQPLGRPRRRWEDNIKTEFNKIGCTEGVNRINLAQDRDKWRDVASEISGSKTCGKFLD
jgi:hypothetical protein